MYRINIYDLEKKLIFTEEVVEYPSDAAVNLTLERFEESCFIDICRVGDDPFEHMLGFDQDLQVDLVEESEYASN